MIICKLPSAAGPSWPGLYCVTRTYERTWRPFLNRIKLVKTPGVSGGGDTVAAVAREAPRICARARLVPTEVPLRRARHHMGAEGRLARHHLVRAAAWRGAIWVRTAGWHGTIWALTAGWRGTIWAPAVGWRGTTWAQVRLARHHMGSCGRLARRHISAHDRQARRLHVRAGA